MKRFLLGILAGLIIAFVTSVVLVFAAVKFSQRKPEPPKEAWLQLRLQGELPEAPQVDVPLPAFEDKSAMTMAETWTLLKRAAADPRIKGVVLKPRGLRVGWGKLEELRLGVEKVRKAGKPVYAWLVAPGTREYYVATAADKIFLSPEDLVDVKGLRVESMHLKGTLDKLGVEMEVEHVGKYKDAGDMLTRTTMSEETKESMNAILDTLFPRFCEVVAQSRKMKPEEVKALIDDGPFLAPQAVKRHLADELTFERNVEEKLAAAVKLEHRQSIGGREYLRSSADQGKARNIALLAAQGDILRGSTADMFGNDLSINPAAMSRELRRIAADSSIKGAIIRIDSPGGDAVASDEILEEMKQLSKKKPVVISMSDVAASGGYYIAMTGDPVVAYPGTLTGSIGVIYGKANLKGLYDKLGITKEVLKRGRFADIDSDFQKLTPEGRAKLRESLEFIYDGFKQHVAEGRRKKVEEVEAVAQGRVWIGAMAKERALVDELGGLDKAVELIRKKAAFTDSEQVRLVAFPGRKTLFEQLFNRGEMGMEGFAGESLFVGPRPEAALLKRLPRGLAPLLEGGVLRVMPYQVEIH